METADVTFGVTSKFADKHSSIFDHKSSWLRVANLQTQLADIPFGNGQDPD